MGTELLTKFKHEEYWTEEYEKFNTLPRDNENTNLFNVGTRDNPDLVMYKFKKQHNNLTDEEWRKLCFSPFVNTQVRRVTIVVEKVVEDNITKKVRISNYTIVKGRKCGAKYFWKQRNITHVTFDLINNNIYRTTTTQIGRKRTTNVLKNPFKYWKLDPFNLLNIESNLNLSERQPTKNLNKLIKNPKYWDIRNKIQSGLNSCFRELVKELSTDDKLFNISLTQKESVLDIASTWFCKVRGIKNPDRWMYYFKNNYPGIKPLRKRDNNLIQTILREEGIYSKFAVKLFNTYKDISVVSYSLMKEALGIHLIQELNPELLREKYHLGWQLNLDLSLVEKRRFISILNSLLESDIDVDKDISMIISDIISDHLGRLKPRLEREGIKVKLKAKTYEEFVQEHREWTDLVDEINKSTIITHIYKKDFLNYIQQPITIEGVKMTPKVLRDTYEYRDESYVQSNCVKTYVEHKDTCIISLRDENDKRITNEFTPMGKDKKMVNVQSRTRFNGKALGTDLQPFIEQLNLKMKKACKEKIYGKTQVIKECKLTGKQSQIEKGRGRYHRNLFDDLPF
tara:strand:- start:22 stop:1725 length:1704 start_codon:yes stop_codon:yes gene_type:complete